MIGVGHQDAHLGGSIRPIDRAVLFKGARTAVELPGAFAWATSLVLGHSVKEEMDMLAG